jgi:hypothetical protein
LRRQYHRRCSVSRPGSGWDWVGPLRSCHGSQFSVLGSLPIRIINSSCFFVRAVFGATCCSSVPAPRLRWPQAEALVKPLQPLDHEHALASPITRLSPRASLPGHLPGVLPASAVRELILWPASRLDAFSGYPARTWLPSPAVSDNWHTSGPSTPVLSY